MKANDSALYLVGTAGTCLYCPLLDSTETQYTFLVSVLEFDFNMALIELLR